MSAGQDIDRYGCLTDSRYPGTIFGRESNPYPNVVKRHVASHHGRSVWGYMLTCSHCGEECVSVVTPSVAYEDAPGRFASEHRHENPLCVAERYRFIPDHGAPETILAETEQEAQTEAAEVFHGRAGALFHTGELYRCERFPDGFLRALDADDPRNALLA